MHLSPLEHASGLVASCDHIARNNILPGSERIGPRARRRSTRTSHSLSFSPCYWYLDLLGSIRREDPPKNSSPHLFPESPQLHATLCKRKLCLDLTCKDPATKSEIKPYRPSFNAGKKHASFVSGAIYELAGDCHSIINGSEKILRRKRLLIPGPMISICYHPQIKSHPVDF